MNTATILVEEETTFVFQTIQSTTNTKMGGKILDMFMAQSMKLTSTMVIPLREAFTTMMQSALCASQSRAPQS